jgi:hypothetical protein
MLNKNKKQMGTLALSNNTIDKYFGYLRKLDNNSKKKLIINLTESIETNEDKPFDLKSLYGAWDDSRDSDEIINQIRESRVNYPEIEEL